MTTPSNNLIVNGSFEDATNFVDNTRSDTMLLRLGDTALSSWTIIGQDDSLSWSGPTAPREWGVVATDGSYWLDLTGFRDTPPYAGIAQTIATQIGHQYLLSF